MNRFVESIAFATHPSLEGHFPGHPVMPGVVLLEKVLLTCKYWAPERQVAGLQSIKFHQPVHPGDRFDIELLRETTDKVRFRCVSGELLYSSGVIILRALS